MANELDAAILSVDYRLSPKSKFPDAINDCYQAYLWAINHSQT
jgi:acetyl esterase/lipase